MVRENSKNILQWTSRVLTPSPHVTLQGPHSSGMNLENTKCKTLTYKGESTIYDFVVDGPENMIRKVAVLHYYINIRKTYNRYTSKYVRIYIENNLMSANSN